MRNLINTHTHTRTHTYTHRRTDMNHHTHQSNVLRRTRPDRRSSVSKPDANELQARLLTELVKKEALATVSPNRSRSPHADKQTASAAVSPNGAMDSFYERSFPAAPQALFYA